MSPTVQAVLAGGYIAGAIAFLMALLEFHCPDEERLLELPFLLGFAAVLVLAVALWPVGVVAWCLSARKAKP